MANSWPPRVENIEPVSGSARKIEEEGEEKEETELETGSSQTRGRVKRLGTGSSPAPRAMQRSCIHPAIHNGRLIFLPGEA